jgi:hypothetical protein
MEFHIKHLIFLNYILQDDILKAAVETYAQVSSVNWEDIAFNKFRGQRTAGQCQCRWDKVIRPGIVKGPWTAQEDQVRLFIYTTTLNMSLNLVQDEKRSIYCAITYLTCMRILN